MEIVARKGLVLLGCGKMGSALLAGWLKAGVSPAAFWVIEPNPTDWLRSTGVHLNEGVPPAPGVALLAVKPQMMGAALPALQALGNSNAHERRRNADRNRVFKRVDRDIASGIAPVNLGRPAAIGRTLQAGNARRAIDMA